MPDAEARLRTLAEAIADGREPDWDSAASSASDPGERALIRQLRAIAVLARLPAAVSSDSFASLSLPTAHPAASAGLFPTELLAWGPLRVIEKIGSGRFGDVYRAFDPNLDREVALKLLRHRRERPNGGSADSLVVHEGRLMARMRHPNLVTVFGAQEIDGRIGLWMELVAGRTLEAELRARGPFPAGDLARVGVELCRALGALHKAGLVHRDVKAQNVLLEDTGRIVLGDLGTGLELLDPDADAASLAGTPAYLAPEIFLGEAATPRSDIYSLGVLLFHLATGGFPVPGRSLREIRDAHGRGARRQLRTHRTDLPRALVATIERALASSPDERFPDAASMESALAAAAEPRAPHRTRWLVAAALGVGLAFAGAAGVWTGRSTAAPGAAGPDNFTAGRPLTGSRTFWQLSSDPTLAGPGAPSPDGRLLSFVDPDTGDLAIHEVVTGKRRRLTSSGDEDARTGYAETSRFSRDGERVFFVWYPLAPDSTGGRVERLPEIHVISRDGGEARLLWRAPPGIARVQFQHWAGHDGAFLVQLWSETDDASLAVVSVETGAVAWQHAVGATAAQWASLSADGRYVAFDRPDPATRLRDIVVVDVAAGVEAPLVADGSASDHSPAWTPDDRAVLFMSDRSGTIALWAQPVRAGRPDGLPVRLEPNLGWSHPMGVTAGGAFFFRRQMGTRDVYVATLRPDGSLEEDPKRVSADAVGSNGSSDWSPDGSRLAFFRRRAERWSLMLAAPGAQGREFADPLFGGIGRPRWEPDGRSVLIKTTYRERHGLHRVDAASGRVEMVLPRQIGHYDLVHRTDEIVYETGRRTLVRHDLRAGTERVLHRLEPGWHMYGLAVSPGGEQLAYTAVGPARAWVLRTLPLGTDAAPRDVFQAPPGERVEVHAWTPDGRDLLVTREMPPESDVTRLWRVDAVTGHARPTSLAMRGINQVRAHPDGRRISFDGGWPAQEVWVLENFLQGLERR